MKKNLIALLVLAALAPITQAQTHFKPQVQIQNHWYNGGNQTGLGVMLPIGNDLQTGFLDARYYHGNQSEHSASIGFGFRQHTGNGIFGIHAYYDGIRSQNKKHFSQASLGLEWFNQDLEVSANAYIPVGSQTKQYATSDIGSLQGNALGILTTNSMEKLNKAMDVEMGATLWQSPKQSLKAFVGGYWQDKEQKSDNLGARVRAEWQVQQTQWLPKHTQLKLGAYLGHDKEKKQQVGLQVKLNFGQTNNPSMPMHKDVNRALIANVQTFEQQHFVKDERFRTAQSWQFSDNQTVDMTALNQNIAKLGEHAVVLVSGELKSDQSLVLNQNQTLLGGGGSLELKANGKTAQFTHQGAKASIINSNDQAHSLVLKDNTMVKHIHIEGGLAGIANHTSASNNIRLHNISIQKTAGDGIKLDNIYGIALKDTQVRDLHICENNTTCEFAVMQNPNHAPNAAFSAIGSRNIQIDNLAAENVTYGVFIASKIHENGDENYERVSDNIQLNNIDITNTRREGLIMVGVDDAKINHYSIDNHDRKENGGYDMDLIVLQASKNIALNNTKLTGGVNGLMIINSSSLPKVQNNNIQVNGLISNEASNSGVFLNPSSNVSLNNVTINQAAKNGLFLYGTDYEFMGGALKNLHLNNVVVNDAKNAIINVWGPIENVHGNIVSNNTKKVCTSEMHVPTELNQDDKHQLNINGSIIPDFSICK